MRTKSTYGDPGIPASANVFAGVTAGCWRELRDKIGDPREAGILFTSAKGRETVNCAAGPKQEPGRSSTTLRSQIHRVVDLSVSSAPVPEGWPLAAHDWVWMKREATPSRLMRTRMSGGVGGGRGILRATRFGSFVCILEPVISWRFTARRVEIRCAIPWRVGCHAQLILS